MSDRRCEITVSCCISVFFDPFVGSGFRLLEHFYTLLHFEDPSMDRYYKRFVRDFVHYTGILISMCE